MDNLIRRSGRYVPMRKTTYLKNIEQIQLAFPWLKNALLSPPPGHLSLLIKLLTQLESIMGSQAPTDLGRLLVIDQDGCLKVTVDDFDACLITKEKVALIKSSMAYAHHHSAHICAVCGDTRWSTGMKIYTGGFCKLHHENGKAGFRFAEDLRRREATEKLKRGALGTVRGAIKQEQRPLDSNQTTEPMISANDLPSMPSKPIDLEPLTVKVFDPATLNAIQKRSDTVNSDQKSRLRSAIERTKAAGPDGYRTLGVFNDGELLVTEFSERFPNFSGLSKLLAESAALSELGDNRVKLPPILLVGPAGIGKTEATSYLANALNIGFRVIDMASTQSSSPLSGSDSFWSNSQEGEVFKALCYHEVANPIILLDEIDKTNGDSRFDPIAPLYSLLELTSAKRFQDQSLKEMTLDASHINWIATANDISAIPKPILSRFIVFEIQPPSPVQARIIAKNIYHGLKRASSWGDHFNNELDDEVMDQLVLLPPRATRVTLQRAFGAAARAGRQILRPEDIQFPASGSGRGFGFMSNP